MQPQGYLEEFHGLEYGKMILKKMLTVLSLTMCVGVAGFARMAAQFCRNPLFYMPTTTLNVQPL